MNRCLNCDKETINEQFCSQTCHQAFRTKQKVASGVLDNRTMRKFLIKERGSKCECCGITEWQNKPVVFEMDHIDGQHKNNSLINLRLLCPNCHSQTPTYKSKNIGNGREFRVQRRKEGKSF